MSATKMTGMMEAKILSAFAKRARDPKAALSAAEEEALGAVLPGYARGGGMAAGFPKGPTGDARGTNELRRTNWFNGRFLTAEALRRQDAYGDMRARLDAHLLMPGIAYGLGLSANGLNGMPVFGESSPPTAGGFAKTQRITLSPGLAFDHVGRPILVAQPFAFTLEQLITISRQTPRRVAPGGTEFAPCVCLVPEPAGQTGGTAAVRPGCYLLIIEPGEVPEGEAKIYGEACAGSSSASTCQSEAWRGAFGLSLVRVPLELPDEPGLNTAWALRGTASAWWFDVFEHSLIRRWDPQFAVDDGFAAPVGPGRHEAGAVALAMVWLGTDGSAIFLDRWIPRRNIVTTPGEDWHRTRFGAPPRAAAWARIHQFQAMLAEHLELAPLAGNQNACPSMNLWQRGFRHIPPIGFLPLDPAAFNAGRGESGGSTGLAILDRLFRNADPRLLQVSRLIEGARKQALAYFRGTTLLPYVVVALHDDDILEDLANVFDKDPVQVGRTPQEEPEGRKAQTGYVLGNQYVGAETKQNPASIWLDQLGKLFDRLGLDELVSRRTEIVKIIIPLQGLTRNHPILGAVPEDARDQMQGWLGSSPPAWWKGSAPPMEAAGMARLRQSLPLDVLPRHFAVYVKQRLVLLDVLVVILEVLKVVLVLTRGTQSVNEPKDLQKAGPMKRTTMDYAVAYQRQPAEQRALVETLLSEPILRDNLARAAVLATPDLRMPTRNAEFMAKMQEIEAQLTGQIADPADRQKEAMARVADAYAAEYPGFQIMQIIAAIQPATEAKDTFGTIAALAAQQPLRDSATGARMEGTVADTVAKDGPVIFARPEAAAVYATMNEALAEKGATIYLAEAPEGVSVKEILAKTPVEAAEALGGASQLALFTEALAKEKAAAAEAARTLTAAPPPEDVTRKLAAAIARGDDAEAAVAAARSEIRNDRAKSAYLDAADTMIRTLGSDRALLFAGLKPGG